MVPILSNIKAFLYSRQIKKIQTNLEFNKNYLPIKVNYYEDQLKQKSEFLDLKIKHKLLPYEIKAGVSSEFLKQTYELQLQKIEEKYYWKKRALKQIIKRKNIDEKISLDKLNKDKNNELDDIKRKYYINTPNKGAELFYNNQAKILQDKYGSKITKIDTKYNDLIRSLKMKVENRINNYQTRYEVYKTKLANLNISSKFSLDEGVLLKVDNLSMHFGGLKAVDKLTFEVKKGEVFGLIGPNGAGKTTVFNCITRFYKPTDGHIYFQNKLNEVVHLNDIVVHNVIREGIVRTFQNVEMIWELNILENLLIAAHTTYRSGFFGHLFNSRLLRQEEVVIRKKAEKILRDLDLIQYTYAYPFGLPYGILKKIELARTLMVNPKLIILDEPAAGLNEAETRVLEDTIRKIRKEYDTTIFLVEHDMGLVMNICDTVCAISFGQKLAIGTPKEIQSSKIVQEAYLGGE